MASNTWNTVGNVANVSGITDFTVNVASGIVCIAAGYKAAAWGSPQTTLQNSWTKLQEIKDKLGAIPAERRQRIEAAATRGLCRSLKSIEAQFEDLWDAHSALSKQYEESSYAWRVVPWTELRKSIAHFESEIKGLLLDTWTTTQAHVSGNRSAPPLGDRTIIIPMDRLPAGSGTPQAHSIDRSSAPPPGSGMTGTTTNSPFVGSNTDPSSVV